MYYAFYNGYLDKDYKTVVIMKATMHKTVNYVSLWPLWGKYLPGIITLI
jgi:hypothetical protein